MNLEGVCSQVWPNRLRFIPQCLQSGLLFHKNLLCSDKGSNRNWPETKARLPLRLRLMDSVARIFRALGTRVDPAVPVRVESTRNSVHSNRDRAGLAWLQMLGRPWASRGDQPPTALGRALAAEFSTSLEKAQMPLHAFLGDPKGAGQLPGGNGWIFLDQAENFHPSFGGLFSPVNFHGTLGSKRESDPQPGFLQADFRFGGSGFPTG